jgi:hypothetical protein
MPTVDEWDAALRTPRLISVESSLNLIDEITVKQQQRDAYLQARHKPLPSRKPLSLVAGFPEYREIAVQPIQLLHRLGVVTTPAIENLADLCSTWAYYRYLWAFEMPIGQPAPERLRLSSDAIDIDFHQKGLMSDQLGVGVAALIMASDFNAPEAADVSTALDDPTWNFTLGRESPDYLFFDPAQTRLYVVECKGTRCSRQEAVNQLRRGTEQLPSLQFRDGRAAPPAFVIGTMMSKSSFRVLMIDPPGEEDSPRITAEDRPRKTGIRSWDIPNSEKFDLASRAVSQSKALMFGGADEIAAKKMDNLYERRRRLPRPTPRKTEITENEFGRFSGIRERMPVRDRLRVEIFQGIDESLRTAYERDDLAEIVAERGRVVRRTGIVDPDNPLRGFGVHYDERQNQKIVQSVAPDGTLLEMRLTPE